MEEDCSATQQHRQRINAKPCRRTEIIPEIERWIMHFEKAKEDLIHFVELDAENAEILLWYHEFLTKIRHLRKSNKMFT